MVHVQSSFIKQQAQLHGGNARADDSLHCPVTSSSCHKNHIQLFSGHLGFHGHYHYLNSCTGFQFLIELILSCPLLHIVLYLHNNHHTLLVSCIFQISLGSSSISQQLIVPKTKLNLGKCAFSVAAPRVWNELPITLKTSETIAIFRGKKLNTYLFQIAFPP